MAGFNAFLDAYNTTAQNGQSLVNAFGETRDRQANAQAGNALASGDYGTAMNALASRGDFANVDLVRQRQTAQQDADLKRTTDVLLHGADALSRYGEADREAAFASVVAPSLKAAGIPDALITKLASAPKSDRDLVAFRASLGGGPKYGFKTAGNTLFTVDENNGQVIGSREGSVSPWIGTATDPDTGAPVVITVPRGTGASGPTMSAPTPGQTAAPQPQAPQAPLTGDVVEKTLAAAFGPNGVTITSGLRTPAHNAEVGGVPNSAHLDDRARDLVPPPGVSMADFYAKVRSILPGAKVLNEGDHVHVQWGGPAQAQPTGGAQVVYRGAPKSDKAPAGYRYKPDGSLEFIPGGPGDPSVAANNRNLRPIPAQALSAIKDNRANISQIDATLAELAKHEDSVGLRYGVSDDLNQRFNPDGIKLRAMIADIGSLKIHDRSGAAVTAAEQPRLMPFIPQVTDTPRAIREKLQHFKSVYGQMLAQDEAYYSDPNNGYRPIGAPAQPSPAPAPAQSGQPRVRRYNPATGRLE